MKVVKFGGTSIGTVERMKLAADSVRKLSAKGKKIFVVVSAMGQETDRLEETLEEAGVEKSAWFLGIGELKSARLFTLILKEMGVRVVEIEPGNEFWPVVLDEGEPDMEEGKKRIKNLLSKYSESEVFVFPGFIAEDKGKKIVTLGRGGSDTSAFILGNLSEAEEVIIVTDVEGVHRTDPNLFPAERIKEIDADRLSDLSAFGAKVIHPEALRFKGESQGSRIIHYKFGDLEYEGTWIFGAVKREVFLLKKVLALVTIHREGLLEDFNGVLEALPHVNIYGITTGIHYAGFYVEEKDADNFAEKVFSSLDEIDLTLRKNIGMIVFKKESPKDRPGLIGSILDKIKKYGINLVEISSIGREVQVFVEMPDAQKVINILKEEEDA